jgi:hypothetical protein
MDLRRKVFENTLQKPKKKRRKSKTRFSRAIWLSLQNCLLEKGKKGNRVLVTANSKSTFSPNPPDEIFDKVFFSWEAEARYCLGSQMKSAFLLLRSSVFVILLEFVLRVAGFSLFLTVFHLNDP